MNRHQMTLDISLELVDKRAVKGVKQKVLETVREIGEAGKFLGERLIAHYNIGLDLINKQYALVFENTTVDIEWLESRNTENEYLKKINVR